jgi:hypothetical protein
VGVRSECLGDGPQHACAVQQNVVIPEAKNTPTVGIEPSIAGQIRLCGSMLTAIGLDNQSCFDTRKIDNIRRDRELTAEADAELLGAQFSPEQALGVG